MQRSLPWFIVAAIASLISGCVGSTRSSEACSPACGDGAVCVDGACRRACNFHTDCLSAEMCNGGVCQTGEITCSDDAECAPAVCDGEKCVECLDEADCDSAPGDSECLLASACVDNECQYTFKVGDTCDVASCQDGIRQPASTCNSDGECMVPAPINCDGYACADMGGSCRTTCADSGDCVAGYTCTTADTCEADGSPSVTYSTIEADPTVLPPDGATAATITVTLRDGANAVLEGVATSVAASGDNYEITPQQAFTNASGQAIFSLTGTAEGSHTVYIAAPEGLESVSTEVDFVAPTMLDYTDSPHSHADCIADGGEVVAVNGDPEGTEVCRFNAATCPGDWEPAADWTTTQQASTQWTQPALTAQTYDCGEGGSVSGTIPALDEVADQNLHSGSHAWDNIHPNSESQTCLIWGAAPAPDAACDDATITDVVEVQNVPTTCAHQNAVIALRFCEGDCASGGTTKYEPSRPYSLRVAQSTVTQRGCW